MQGLNISILNHSHSNYFKILIRFFLFNLIVISLTWRLYVWKKIYRNIRRCGRWYRLSNRGTQVWPESSLFTELIDQYRVRIERKPMKQMTQQEILNLATKVAEKYKNCSIEYLMSYGGKKAYSLAQGQ